MHVPQSVLDALGIKPVPMFTLSSWIKAAAKCGFNIEPLFKEAGIKVDLIHLEEARVSPLQLISLLEQCVALSPQKYFPFVLGDTFAFESLPEFETMLTTSPTLREALAVADMARKVILPWITLNLKEDAQEAQLVVGFDVPETLLRAYGLPIHYVIDGVLATLRKFARSLQGSQDGFVAVALRIAQPANAAIYHEYFGVPVRFGQPYNALIFEPRILDHPLEGAFPSLHEQAQYLAEQRLGKEIKRLGLAAEIEDGITRDPELLAMGMEEMAERLHMHPRTMQRRLKDEGDSYLQLQARMRHRLACTWLRDPTMTIEDISARLGFSDRRAFSAAFKRWEGATPSAYREQG